MTHSAFEDLSDVYESLVDWPRRLARESPFFQRLFTRHDVHRVVDAACGTGHHAAAFHQWGLEVEGADVSPAMIQRARERFGEAPRLRWSVRSFDSPIPAGPQPDAVICTGNSLALATDHHAARRAVHEMLRAVRAGGIVVVHVINLQSLPDGPCIWQKCVRYEHAGAPALIHKGIHRSGDLGYVDLLVSASDPASLLSAQSVPFLGITGEQLRAWAQHAEALTVTLYGDYQGHSFDAGASTDLIAVMERSTGTSIHG